MPLQDRPRSAIALTRACALWPLVVLAGCSWSPLPPGATEQSRALHGTWIVFFWAGLGVMAVVSGLIFWCLLRYRRRDLDGSFPPQFRRNNRMEILYTAIPVLMVGGLFAITYPTERHVETIAQHPANVVDVTAFRWSWQFSYPRSGVSVTGSPTQPPELVLPLGTTTQFSVTSVDVDHSFWVPAFLFKRDAIPGLRNVFDWTPDKLGTFRGECGEYCGLDHAHMSFQVRVVTPAEFDRWQQAHHNVALVGSAR